MTCAMLFLWLPDGLGALFFGIYAHLDPDKFELECGFQQCSFIKLSMLLKYRHKLGMDRRIEDIELVLERAGVGGSL